MNLARVLHIHADALVEEMVSRDEIEVIDVSDGSALVIALADGTVTARVANATGRVLTITRPDGTALVLVVPVDSNDELDDDDPYLDLGEGD